MSFNALRLLFRRDPVQEDDWNSPRDSLQRQPLALFLGMMSLLTFFELVFSVSTMVVSQPGEAGAASSTLDTTQQSVTAGAAAGGDTNKAAGAAAGTQADAASPTTPATAASDSSAQESPADTFMKAILLSLLILIGVSQVCRQCNAPCPALHARYL